MEELLEFAELIKKFVDKNKLGKEYIGRQIESIYEEISELREVLYDRIDAMILFREILDKTRFLEEGADVIITIFVLAEMIGAKDELVKELKRKMEYNLTKERRNAEGRLIK